MNKQTAVEWLYQLSKQRELDKFDLEQAKRMEKEQIITAHLTGLIHPLEIEATKQAEQYYNETYVKDVNFRTLKNICECQSSNCCLINGSYICSTCNRKINT